MADPKYPEYNGVLRFDDDNLVEVGLQPDTENITVKLNGVEIPGGGGAGLPEVDSSDNGDVLTVVEGEWANAAPASQLPAVSGSDNGNVLTVVEGAWAKASLDTPVMRVTLTEDSQTGDYTIDKQYSAIAALLDNGGFAYLYDTDTSTYYPVTRLDSDLDGDIIVFTMTPTIQPSGVYSEEIIVYSTGAIVRNQYSYPGN